MFAENECVPFPRITFEESASEKLRIAADKGVTGEQNGATLALNRSYACVKIIASIPRPVQSSSIMDRRMFSGVRYRGH